MTKRRQADPDEWLGAHDEENPRLDTHLYAALAVKPAVAIPQGFATATAARAMQLRYRSAATQIGRQLGIRWGLTTTVASLTLLLVLMIRYALSAPLAIAMPAEMTLCIEFLALLWGLLHFRRILP